MTRSPLIDDEPRTVPPPLDTRIPTDDELDAQCDQLLRFDVEADVDPHADAGLIETAPVPHEPQASEPWRPDGDVGGAGVAAARRRRS